MKIKQTCINNLGITTNKSVIVPGYRADDGVNFDINSELHEMHECIAKIIKLFFPKAKTILDVGSGAGNLSYFLRKFNDDITVVTLDGNPATINSPFIKPEHHFVVRTDEEYKLVDENNNLIQFDLVCSFEHFEHIEPKKFGQFLSNIKTHSHEKTFFWASAATYKFHKTEEAHVHCNVQSYEAWLETLFKGGFSIFDISLFKQYYHLLHEAWLPPHGRAAVSHEFLFKNSP